MRGTGEQRQLLGTGNIGNQDFDFGEKRTKRIISGEQISHLEGPQKGSLNQFSLNDVPERS